MLGRGLQTAIEPCAGLHARRAATAMLTALAAFFCASCSRSSAGKTIETVNAARPVAVQSLTVASKAVRRNIESVGSLFAYEEVTVSSEVEGRVERVLVDVGDRVASGQAIVKVAPAELELTLEQQRAALRQARARLGINDDNDDLQDVRAAAEVKRAAADLADAEQKYRRAKSLYEQGVLPRQNFDEAESRYNVARAAYDLAMQSVENMRAQLAGSRASTRLAQKKLNDSTIRAPFAGQVKERAVTQGQYLKVQTPVMVIVNIDPLRVRLKVPEKMAAWVHEGQEVTVTVEAYADRAFKGKVTRINPSVDQQTRAFEVEALIENHDNTLKPGFFAKAVIQSNNVTSALFVPQDALLYVYGVYKVFVIEDHRLKEKDVKLGERTGDEVEITDGLREGERVALPAKGQELRDGAAVEVVQ
ncbi:MAG: efflux RND transporter periplasmic adaptor subunit [Blastocatellia bacterium]